ncbi:META domain-containing protein [Lentzea sp. NPDC054927]
MGYRVLVAVIALLVTGCGTASTGTGGGDVKGKVFSSTSVTEQGKPRALVDGTKVELRFTDDGRLIANAGCNMMQGPVSLADGKLTVTDLSTTDMACPEPGLHQQDEWLGKLLSAAPSWRMDGANLVITGSDAEIVLAAEAPATLEGGTWIVDGLITSDATSSVPAGVRATISFKEGKAEVAAGCNSAGGTYEVDGESITFGQLATELKLCGPDEMAVEKAVLDALSQGPVTYKIDRNTLTLTNAKGQGLQLRK